MIYYGKIENGKFQGKIDVKKFEGKTVCIEIKEHKKTRSSLQNRYYWGVVLEYLEDGNIGYKKDEWHEILKEKFLKHRVIEFEGESYKIIPSTAGLNTEEFMIYLENVRDFSSQELNCYIPSPEEYYEGSLNENTR